MYCWWHNCYRRVIMPLAVPEVVWARSFMTQSLLFSSCLLPALFIIGCADSHATTRPASLRERQEQAMRDPMHYSPDLDHNDISGGGLDDFNRDSFKKDWDNILNP